MNLHKSIDMIQTEDDFIEFVNLLIKDNAPNPSKWENKSAAEYLKGIASWVEDMNGYYDNMNLQKPTDIDWKFIAALLYVGKIYE